MSNGGNDMSSTHTNNGSDPDQTGGTFYGALVKRKVEHSFEYEVKDLPPAFYHVTGGDDEELIPDKVRITVEDNIIGDLPQQLLLSAFISEEGTMVKPITVNIMDRSLEEALHAFPEWCASMIVGIMEFYGPAMVSVRGQ